MQRSEMAGVRMRRGIAVLVSLLMAAAFVQAQPAAASHYTNTTELGGTSNVGVAVSWSKAAFTGTATEALLGRDDLFADSLASGSMQGTRPLLLTNSQTLSPETNTELSRLRPSVVNIMGGPSAVSTAVENDLKGKGYTVRRFSGPTRLETAIDIARRALPAATSAIVAAGFGPQGGDPTRAFADSIAAGGWAADRVMPVLLTETERLSVATKNYLRGSAIRTVFVVGGTSAVSEAAVAELRQIGMTVRRVSGPTRFDTAVRIAAERGASDASKVAEVILTEGQAADSWVAGFAAAAYSAAKDAPIVLSNGATLPAPTTTFLSPPAKAAATKLLCAPRVNSGACDAASEAMGHTAVSGAMPRLVSVAVGTTASGLKPVRFKFSEPLAAQVTAANFGLYTYDATRVAPVSAALDPAQPDTVIAQFTDSAFNEFTVAGVATGAVRSATSALPNPEASAGLQNYTRSAGQTRGPRLVDVDPVDEDGDEWQVLFTFDRALTACGPKNLFHLVEQDHDQGDLGVDTHTGNSAGAATRDGTHSCLVDFAFGTGGEPDGAFSDAIARGVALPGAATASTGVSASTTARLATSAGPDLSGLSVAGNVASFTFDRNVDATIEGGGTTLGQRFHVVDSRGRQFSGISAAIDATAGTGGSPKVDVTFPSGALQNVIVTGWVAEDAVKTSAVISPTGAFNGTDAVYRGGDNTFTGTTHVPPVTAIARAISGSTATVRYTFAGPVEPSGGAGRFVVYDDAGARTELTSCSVDAGTPANDIVCTGGQTTSAPQFTAISRAVYAGASRDAYRPEGQAGDPVDDSLLSPETGRLLT